MKYIFAISILLFVFACKQSERNKNIIKEVSNISISDNGNIYGQWMMCSKYNNGVTIQFNDCPKISFGVYGTGSVIFSGATANFTWTLKNTVLTISNMVKSSNKTFSDTVYNIAVDKVNESFNLNIINTNGDEIFYLSKL